MLSADAAIALFDCQNLFASQQNCLHMSVYVRVCVCLCLSVYVF